MCVNSVCVCGGGLGGGREDNNFILDEAVKLNFPVVRKCFIIKVKTQ